MADFDAVTHKDVESSRRRAFNTLNQKVDASLLNPRVGWTDPAQGGASGTRAPFDPAAQYELGGDTELTIDADLDMNSYDIIELDRLFFKSDDGLTTSSGLAHITSDDVGERLYYFAAAGERHQFNIGTDAVLVLRSNEMDVNLPLNSDDSISTTKFIRTGTYSSGSRPGGNGALWYESGKIKARLGGNIRDLLNSDVDIDLKKNNLLKVDRIYFDSDSANTYNDPGAYIRCEKESDQADRILSYYVKSQSLHKFFCGPNLSLSIFETSIVSHETMRFLKDVNLGKYDSTDDQVTLPNETGSVWYDSGTNEFKGKTNTSIVTFGGSTTADPSEPVRLRVRSASFPYSGSNPTKENMNSWFGGWNYAVGLIKPTGTITDSSTGMLVWKKQRRASGGDRRWLGIQMLAGSNDSATTTSTDNGFNVSQKRIANPSFSTNQTPGQTPRGEDGNAIDLAMGRIGAHADTSSSDANDGSIWVCRTDTLVKSDIRNYDFGTDTTAEVSDGGVVLDILNLVYEVGATTWPSNDTLDTVFGVDDGSIGFYALEASSSNRLYAKMGGWWFHANVNT